MCGGGRGRWGELIYLMEVIMAVIGQRIVLDNETFRYLDEYRKIRLRALTLHGIKIENNITTKFIDFALKFDKPKENQRKQYWFPSEILSLFDKYHRIAISNEWRGDLLFGADYAFKINFLLRLAIMEHLDDFKEQVPGILDK
jgi:hypothetical protein